MRSWFLATAARFRELGRRSSLEAERDEEFGFHLEMEIEHNRRRGMSDAEARRVALLAFGGVERFREETHEARGIAALENVLRDARYAIRRLRRAPSFAMGVIATLGVGVGTAVAIGALVYGVMLRPLPYSEPDRIVNVAFRTPGLDDGREAAHSHASYIHFKESTRALVAFGGYHVNDAVNLTDGGDPERVSAVMATPGVLEVLRVVPAAGRALSQEDAEVPTTAATPVMITHGLWQQRYGGDPSVVGRVIQVNRRARRVVGVLPRGFGFPAPVAAVWFPLDDVRGERWGGPPSLQSRYATVIARLGDDATIEAAEAELRSAIPRFSERFPTITPAQVAQSHAHAEVLPLKEATIAPVRQHFRLLALTVIVVLLIAGANLTNLFLLRAERSRHEVAVARALGARSLDLAQRFVAEGVVLGLAGAVIALPIVSIAVASHFGFTAREIPRLHEVTLSASTMATVFLVSLMMGVVVSLMGFVRAGSARLGERIRASSGTVTGGWRLAQRGLVTVQVAIALTLLLGAALFGRSLWNLRRVELGFVPEGRVTFEVTLPWRGYETYAGTALFHRGVLDRLRAIPGIQGAEAAMEVPLIQENPGELSFEYDAVGTETSERGAVNMASAGYFRLMGIPLLHGRSFMAGDIRAENPAIVLSASLARALFGDIAVVGRMVRPPSPGADIYYQVVGVVKDVPRWRIEDGPARMAYFPLLPDGDGVPKDSIRIPILMHTSRYVLRTDVPPGQLAPALRAVVREMDPAVPVTNLTSLPAMVDAATARLRLTMLLLAVCRGGVAAGSDWHLQHRLIQRGGAAAGVRRPPRAGRHAVPHSASRPARGDHAGRDRGSHGRLLRTMGCADRPLDAVRREPDRAAVVSRYGPSAPVSYRRRHLASGTTCGSNGSGRDHTRRVSRTCQVVGSRLTVS
jgi:putative ABC transport system permease protein